MKSLRHPRTEHKTWLAFGDIGVDRLGCSVVCSGLSSSLESTFMIGILSCFFPDFSTANVSDGPQDQYEGDSGVARLSPTVEKHVDGVWGMLLSECFLFIGVTDKSAAREFRPRIMSSSLLLDSSAFSKCTREKFDAQLYSLFDLYRMSLGISSYSLMNAK